MNDDILTQIATRHLQRWSIDSSNIKVSLPKLAKDKQFTNQVEDAVKEVPTLHHLSVMDSRHMDILPNESVHLVITSPPYWTLKRYQDIEGQLGNIHDYERFLDELDKVWHHCLRVLVQGGRLVIIIGDVCLSRKRYQRHVVLPLHASLQERCRKLGYDNLAPIIWSKISNARFEVDNGSGFLGKPYEPNAIIKNDIEYILMQRKPHSYRSPSIAARLLSIIPEEDHKKWFRQIWIIPGASTRNHPAPFPIELAQRLVRMFSFVGDTILDPFMGTGTTNLAASMWGRNSIGFEIDKQYVEHARERISRKQQNLFTNARVDVKI